MIVDTSAVVAILRMEPEARKFAETIAGARNPRISAVNYVEAAAVIDSARNPIASRRFDDFMRAALISVEAVTPEQARIAREAYRDFGKGSGHAAGLNFGDCFAYALARTTDEAILFKGDDFSKTDLVSAL
jgi:ribonuclease VapC